MERGVKGFLLSFGGGGDFFLYRGVVDVVDAGLGVLCELRAGAGAPYLGCLSTHTATKKQ